VRLSRISFSTDHEPPLEEREQLYCAVMAALGLDPDEWRHREIDEDMKRRMTKAMEGHRIQVMLSELSWDRLIRAAIRKLRIAGDRRVL
jgi:hypothetical protein